VGVGCWVGRVGAVVCWGGGVAWEGRRDDGVGLGVGWLLHAVVLSPPGMSQGGVVLSLSGMSQGSVILSPSRLGGGRVAGSPYVGQGHVEISLSTDTVRSIPVAMS
jgi:hypothetical protein